MSGIEIAGLMLGALPILIKAVSSYKDCIRRSATAFRKRQFVKKLGQALLLQQQMLKETVKSVLLASGCDDVEHRLGVDPAGYMNDILVQELALDFLGLESYTAFCGTLEQSYSVMQEVAKNLAGLLPLYQGPADDLVEVIARNEAAPNKKLEYFSFVTLKLLFSSSELQAIVVELDETTNTLCNFTRLLVSNRRTVDGSPSKQAEKLASALGRIRGFAENLYTALCQGWKPDCHKRHEAKLFLEDRIDTSSRAIIRDNSTPVLIFQVLFAASLEDELAWWHETPIQVYNNDDDAAQPSSQLPSPAKVKIVAPLKSADRLQITVLDDICSAIEARNCGQRHVAFVLAGQQQVGTIPAEKKMWMAHDEPITTTLKNIFLSAIRSPRRGPVLPWKFRMHLALTLCSNLLQLLQTQWLARPWSSEIVSFLVEKDQSSSLGRPFVSLSFDNTIPNQPQSKVKPKVVLIELGILLLEIWHEVTLEIRFSLTGPVKEYERLALALEWCDDTNDPLPELYEKAVSHCLVRTGKIDAHVTDWEDKKIWAAVCGDIIDPLSKICKQWR